MRIKDSNTTPEQKRIVFWFERQREREREEEKLGSKGGFILRTTDSWVGFVDAVVSVTVGLSGRG